MHKILRGLRHPLDSFKRLNKKFEFRQGFAGPVKNLNIQPCIACNLRCTMCFQHKVNSPGSEAYNKMLELSHLKKALDETASFKPVINLIGGEPMVHPKIDEIIKEIKSRCLFLSITTNGFKMVEKAQMLVDEGVDIIFVSLDGREEINDANRSIGSYRMAVDGLRELIKVRNESGKDLPKIKIIGTITEITFSELADLADIANEFGVDELSLSHLQFYPQTLINQQIEWMGKHLRDCFDTEVMQTQTDNFKKFVIAPTRPIDPQVVIEQKKIIREKLKADTIFSTLPNYSDDEIKRYYNSDYDNYKRPAGDVCLSPYYAVTLASTGDLAFCLGYNGGNIENEKIADIWNNKRTRHFRKALLKQGRFPLCQRCCG